MQIQKTLLTYLSALHAFPTHRSENKVVDFCAVAYGCKQLAPYITAVRSFYALPDEYLFSDSFSLNALVLYLSNLSAACDVIDNAAQSKLYPAMMKHDFAQWLLSFVNPLIDWLLEDGWGNPAVGKLMQFPTGAYYCGFLPNGLRICKDPELACIIFNYEEQAFIRKVINKHTNGTAVQTKMVSIPHSSSEGVSSLELLSSWYTLCADYKPYESLYKLR